MRLGGPDNGDGWGSQPIWTGTPADPVQAEYESKNDRPRDNFFVQYIRRFVPFTTPFTLPEYDRVPLDFLPLPRMARVRQAFAYRREYGRDSQTFDGAHTLVTPGAKASTSPSAMLPPRVPRLTHRPLPGSYGELTEVLR